MATDTLVVRTGVPSDIMPIMEMAKMGAEENGMVPYDLNAILHEFWPALHLDHGIVGLVGEPNGKPEGAVLLRVTNFWYGFREGPRSRPMLEERWLWTDPKFRAAKGGRARKLCEFAKASAETLGLPLMIGILSNIRLDAKIRLYERVFGKPNGCSWYYEAPSVPARAAPSDMVREATL